VTPPLLLVDTSAAIALVVAGHEAHDRTIEALDGRSLGLAGHAWFETFSVLTRLPPPARRRAHEVTAILSHNFPHSRFLSEEATREVTARIDAIGVTGGAVYDALVGYVAVLHGLPLATRDQRAVPIYRALDTTVEVLP